MITYFDVKQMFISYSLILNLCSYIKKMEWMFSFHLVVHLSTYIISRDFHEVICAIVNTFPGPSCGNCQFRVPFLK